MVNACFKTSKISLVFVFLLALLPLFNIKMVSIAIILFVIGAFINYIYGDNKNKLIEKKQWYVCFLFAAIFFFYLIALAWTSNTRIGFKQLEKVLPFLFIPFTIFILKPFKTKQQLSLFFKTYVIANVVLVVLTFVYILYHINDILSPKANYIKSLKLREYIEGTPVIGEHTIYFSLLMATALLLLYYHRFKLKILNVILALVLFAGLLIASSRGVVMALFFVASIILFQKIKNKRNAIATFAAMLALFSGVVYFSPLKVRVNEIVENKYFYPEGVHFNSFNLRTAIYNCSFNLAKKAGFFGFSPGDTQNELNTCYKKFNTNAFTLKKYNTHNQYLDYLLAFGFLGVVSILMLFGYYLHLAMKYKDKLYFNFLILIYLIFLIENLLVRNTGIIVFCLFNCLFAYRSINKLTLKA